MYLFGSGILWGTPLTDASGAAIAAPTPIIFGTLQDVDVDIKFDIKELHGQNQFPAAVGRGKGSIGGKAKVADIRAAAMETLIFGVAGAAGIDSAVYDTVGATIPTTPFTVTPTVPSSGTWAADMGVIDSTTGREMKRVASGPTAGQYSVAAGVYTFAAADTGKLVYINYRYTATSTVARTITGTNLPMGYAPTFRADLYMPFQGKYAVLQLYSCIADGMKLSPKNDDFTVPEVGFKAFANAAGQVYKWSLSE